MKTMKDGNRYVRISLIGSVVILMLACNIPIKTSTQSGAPNNSLTAEIPITAADKQSLPVEISEPPMTGKDGATLVYVPKGDFVMGNDANNALVECKKFRNDCKIEWFLREAPPHVVTLDAFWINQTEVTNAMYEKCVKAAVCKKPTNASSKTHSNYYGNPEFDNYPVIYVDWDRANAYCSWVGLRLPTEAEWEKAARGTDERTYPWGNNAPNANLLNYDLGIGDVAGVGNYEAGKSAYGAYDMAGNVVEWVNDWYSETYYQNSPAVNPLGPDQGQSRVLRSGSWGDVALSVRAANRNSQVPAKFYVNVGFRCARSEVEAQILSTPTSIAPMLDSMVDPMVRDPGNGGGQCSGYLSDDGEWVPFELVCSTSTAPAIVAPASADRCSIFDNRNIKVTMLEWSSGMPLNFYLKMSGGVPGLEDKTVDDGSPWNYSVDIDGYVTDKCEVQQGYKERLYCSIQLPSDYSFSLRPLTLTVNGCETPVYKNITEEIPPIASGGAPRTGSGTDSGTGSGDASSSSSSCDTLSGEAWCSCLGGTWSPGRGGCGLP